MVQAVAMTGGSGRRRRRTALAATAARWGALRLTALMLAVVWCLTPAWSEPRFPPLTGRIVDEAGLLNTEDRTRILAMLRELEQKSTDQIVVYTTRSLQGYPIEEFGYRLGRFWQIGQQGKNNGIVLIVAPADRKVRIEVGRGLEPQMTDLMSKLIIDNAILPAFRRGDFSAGIAAGVRDIKDVLLGDAEAVKERARGGQKRNGGTETADLLMLVLMLAVFIFIVWRHHQQLKSLPRNARYRRQGGDVIVLPGGWGGSGGWTGGSPSGGGSSDPDSGWSGGGGDFGGGGASGSW
jgi:uncharacterized protein